MPKPILFKKITNIEECKKLWEQFSSKKSVWDLWEINYAFTEGYGAFPVFIAGFENNSCIGILPLETNLNEKGEKFYDFLGGDYPEKRTFFLNDKKLIYEFLKQIPGNTLFLGIDASEKHFINELEEGETNYSLDLTKLNGNPENYFSTFSKKHRKNLNYDLKKLEKLKPKSEWNTPINESHLAELNLLRFGEESNFTDGRFIKSMDLLLSSAEKLKILHFLTIKINEKIEASQPALFYDGVYYVLTGGVNPKINNLGKMLICEHIKNAFKLKARGIDFLSTDTGWKKLWNLEETKLYNLDLSKIF